jgi:sarcosine oxidase subunit alpha
VTVRGLDRALGAGLRHVEHVKRYTLIGTGVEQGRAAKLNAGALTALGWARPIAEVGTSSARPPVEPVGFHAVGGRASGPRYEPIRTTSIHELHRAARAVFEPAGQWLRPRVFPATGESLDAAVLRDCRAVRESVGLMDASTLGKIDVQGPDAARFIDRLYINPMASLEPGKGRYGVMCHSDGMVFDDGVVLRLEANRFFVTTTTGNAAPVLDWMEEWLQTEWPDLRVWVSSVTEQWATVAIVGPRSRDVIRRLAPALDCSNDAFPFLAHRRARVAGIDDARSLASASRGSSRSRRAFRGVWARRSGRRLSPPASRSGSRGTVSTRSTCSERKRATSSWARRPTAPRTRPISASAE